MITNTIREFAVVAASMLFISTCLPLPSRDPSGTEILAHADPETTKALFIGSSYFSGNNLPMLFKELVLASGKQVEIGTHIINGMHMEELLQDPATTAIIQQRQWDFVFLHESGPPVGYPETHYLFIPPYIQRHSYEALEQFKQIIAQNSDKTTMIFLMPWAFEDGLTWIPGQTDTFEDMQWKIYHTTIQWSREIGFPIAPVGWAWRAVILERPQLHYLFLSDFNHPSLRGSYLTACALYVTTFKESVAGNSYHGGLPVEEAEYFQQVGSRVVMDSLELWNIPVSAIHESGTPTGLDLHLYQNFPNPFNPKTSICFTVPMAGPVTLSIFNLFGQAMATLVDGWCYPGRQAAEWNARNCPSGIYICRLRAGMHSQSRKLLLLK